MKKPKRVHPAKQVDPSKATWLVGMFQWRKKGGFFKRQLQPAIIECVDGTKVEISLRPWRSVKEVLAAVQRVEDYYNNDMPLSSLRDDRTPLKPRRDLPKKFTLQPSGYRASAVPQEVTLTPYDALRLGLQLLDFAKAEKAERPCEICNTLGRVGAGPNKTVPCRPCRGKGWTKPSRAGILQGLA